MQKNNKSSGLKRVVLCNNIILSDETTCKPNKQGDMFAACTFNRKKEVLFLEKMLISTPELQKMIGCGRANAVKFGDEAGARVRVGKLLRWNVTKIQNHMDEVSNGKEK